MASLETGELSIGKLAEELEISTAAINFYVKEGVLPPPRKLNRTRAAYSQRHLRLLRVLKRMQASGYSLGLIRKTFEHFGTDAQGLAKLEGIGSLKPLPPIRSDPNREPIELFSPIDRVAFLERAGVEGALVDTLESWGVLRPGAPDRYDARDLWLVLTVKSLLEDGVELPRLEYYRETLGAMREMSFLVMDIARRHTDALRSRELRVSEVIQPFNDIFRYLFDRVHDEQHPKWREMLFIADEEAGED